MPTDIAQTARLDTEHLQSHNISEILAHQNALRNNTSNGQIPKSNILIQEAQKRSSDLQIDLEKVQIRLDDVAQLPRQEGNHPLDPANIT